MSKSTAVPRFIIAALVVFSSVAFANAAPAQKPPARSDVTAAAAAVPTLHYQEIALNDEEILAAASPVAVTMHGPSVHSPALTAAAETESPVTEGPDAGGPGGPDHQFDGQETGQH